MLVEPEKPVELSLEEGDVSVKPAYCLALAYWQAGERAGALNLNPNGLGDGVDDFGKPDGITPSQQ